MRRFVLFVLVCAVACAGEPTTAENPDAIPSRPQAGIQLPIIEDNIAHDTLLIHETFALEDGTFIMSARNNEEPDSNRIDPGLRLYHYRLHADSMEVLSYSNPAYDSWMMRPFFFEHPAGGYVILAEFGSTESWGQKVMIFNNGFTDIGFLDVATNELKHLAEIDSSYMGKGSIAPWVEMEFNQEYPTIKFNADSVFVYDDLQGHLDTVYHGAGVSYEPVDGKLVLQVQSQ